MTFIMTKYENINLNISTFCRHLYPEGAFAWNKSVDTVFFCLDNVSLRKCYMNLRAKNMCPSLDGSLSIWV